LNIELLETVRPESEAPCRYGVADGCRHAGAGATVGDAFPGEEGEDGAGGAGFVAVVEMIGPRVVEIDGLFDHPEPQYFCIKIMVALGVACDGGDVVDAKYVVVHVVDFFCGDRFVFRSCRWICCFRWIYCCRWIYCFRWIYCWPVIRIPWWPRMALTSFSSKPLPPP